MEGNIEKNGKFFVGTIAQYDSKGLYPYNSNNKRYQKSYQKPFVFHPERGSSHSRVPQEDWKTRSPEPLHTPRI